MTACDEITIHTYLQKYFMDQKRVFILLMHQLKLKPIFDFLFDFYLIYFGTVIWSIYDADVEHSCTKC